jgi:hypothetical protein
MLEKQLVWMGAVLLAIGISGCRNANPPKQAAARKPVDTTKPLAPQLFPVPATNNAWFHVISTSDELKFNPKLSQSDDLSNLAKSSPKDLSLIHI